MILNLVPFLYVCYCTYDYYERMFHFCFDVVHPIVNNKIVIKLNTKKIKKIIENGTISITAIATTLFQHK